MLLTEVRVHERKWPKKASTYVGCKLYLKHYKPSYVAQPSGDDDDNVVERRRHVLQVSLSSETK